MDNFLKSARRSSSSPNISAQLQQSIKSFEEILFTINYTGAPIVEIARWSVPRIGQGPLEVK